MQPFQCDLRCSAAKDRIITHAAVVPRNLDAAITMRWHHHFRNPNLSAHIATQHCNIHAAIPLAICKPRFQITLKLRTQYRIQSSLKPKFHYGKENMKTNGPQPPHTRGTFHRRLSPLYREKHKVSCPNYLPKQNLCDIHAAITVRCATSLQKFASPPFIALYSYVLCGVKYHTALYCNVLLSDCYLM